MVAARDGEKISSYRERNSTADRALDILGLFSDRRLRLTGSDLASELGVARSTAYRYLQTLIAAGYLEEDPAGGFRLGLKVLELARLARRSYGLSEIAMPVLRTLANSTHETVLLTRRSGDRVVCLERIEDDLHPVRLSYERGSVLPLNAGASAWVLLAWEDPEVVDQLLTSAQFDAPTANALTDPRAIQDRLNVIRVDGYAVSRGELDPDAIGIAAPVRDEAGRVVAGVSIAGIARRVAQHEAELVSRVRSAADAISDSVALASH